jgi:hypothetical protein
MPYEDEQLDEGRGLLRVWTGVVTVNEVIAASSDYYAHEDWTKLEYVIADYSGVTEVQATAGQIRKLSILDANIANFKPLLVIAIVAPRTSPLAWRECGRYSLNGRDGASECSGPEAEVWVQESIDGLSKRPG